MVGKYWNWRGVVVCGDIMKNNVYFKLMLVLIDLFLFIIDKVW